MTDDNIHNNNNCTADNFNFNVTGLLLAAGKAKRMGTAKQMLPWESHKKNTFSKNAQTVIESAFDGLAPHCKAGVIVVLGNIGTQEIKDKLANRKYSLCISDPDAPMIKSMCIGLEHILNSSPANTQQAATHVLLHPADNPVVTTEVVQRIFSYSSKHKATAVIPTCNSKGGHPVLLPVGIVDKILSAYKSGKLGNEGLRSFWKLYPEFVTRLEFENNKEILLDLDTPENYAIALREYFG